MNQEQAVSLQTVVCPALPLAVLRLPDAQGAIQRLMDRLIFTGVWLHDPKRSHGT